MDKLLIPGARYKQLERFRSLMTLGTTTGPDYWDVYLREWYTDDLTFLEKELVTKFLGGDDSAIEVGKSPEVPAFKAISLTSDNTPNKTMYLRTLVISDEKVLDFTTTLDVAKALLFKTFEGAEKYGRLLEGYKCYNGWDVVTVLIPEGELK